jgi:hypothetical protein
MDLDKHNQDHSLTGKIDQLLGKAPMDDRNIPLLTDIVDAPTWTPATASPSTATSALSPEPILLTDEVSPPETAWLDEKPDVLYELNDDEIDQLSQDIFARVSQRIDSELATSLEARLSEQFQTQLNATISHVLSDMKQSIANEIGDAVNAALADRLRNK